MNPTETPASNHTHDHTMHEHDHHTDHDEHAVEMRHDHDEHAAHGGQGHAAHTDHAGHEEMFRRRFWVSLVLTIPVLLFSPTIQEWLGFSMPEFPGSEWIAPIFSIAIGSANA